MQVRVTIDQSGMKVDEAFTGTTADEVVGKMKARVAKELNFALRVAVNAMSNLAFAQEVVKRLNESKSLNLPPPKTCTEFIQMAQEQGFATIEEA